MKSPQSIIKITMLLAGTSLLTACGGAPKCESEGRYMLSQEGRRIEAPDDLDDLQSYKEMTIPQASPRGPREDTSKCIEAPPELSSSSSA